MRPVFLFAKQMYILIQRIINISVLDKLLSGFMKIKWESFEFSSSTGKHDYDYISNNGYVFVKTHVYSIRYNNMASYM